MTVIPVGYASAHRYVSMRISSCGRAFTSMAISLQDQLLKAGVASKQQANKAKAQKRKSKKQAQPTQSESERLAQQRADKQQHDRLLNQQKAAEQAQRADQAAARQIILQYQLALDQDAPIRYSFVDGKQIKYLYVTGAQQNQLARSQLVICKLDQRYTILPASAAEKVAQRQPEWVLHNQASSSKTEDDDYYAQFTIPDDLMW